MFLKKITEKIPKLSIRAKITIWYTAAIIILSAIVITAMSSLSRDMIKRDISMRVNREVEEYSRMLSRPDSMQPGKKKQSLPFYEQGVHLAVYDNNGTLIAGNIPFESVNESDFADGQFDNISDSSGEYYVLTKAIHGMGKDDTLWLRGAASVTEESYSLSSSMRMNVIITIILAAAASFGGFIILGRAMAPVKKITQTAQRISESSDLSQRIKIGSGGDEIHELAQTFDNMLDRIEQTFEREKQFTSDASHELRTPVAVILSECEYMADCSLTAEEYREAAASVKDQAEKMSRLINELLTISRMERNAIKLDTEETDVSELLNFVCDEQEELHNKDIVLTRDITPDICAYADRLMLMRLFINLISNAYSYGKENGHIHVSLSIDGNTIKVSVKDDGIGISAENLSKIWERFYQADPARTPDRNGSSGLGLPIAKMIATLHNGNISVSSKIGEGSEFIFTFPANIKKSAK